MVKNKWYERSHWTYKEICGWLIERGISFVEFQKTSLINTSAGKIECPIGNHEKLPIRPRSASEEKTREKDGEKKGAENDLPYTYGDATSDDVISVKSRSASRSTSNTSPIQHDILLTIVYMIVLGILAQYVYQISVTFY
jgi:hypothetical protein